MKLRSTINKPAIGEAIADAFKVWSQIPHENATTYFDHGHWWVTCSACGVQYDAVDAEGGDSVDGFSFEEVTHGDDSCAESEESCA